MGRSQQCTLMLRNVPNRYTKQELLHDLAPMGFKNGRDIGYVHLPIDTKTRSNRGYAFVTMKTLEAAERLRKLEGERLPRYHTKKILEVTDGGVQAESRRSGKKASSSKIKQNEVVSSRLSVSTGSTRSHSTERSEHAVAPQEEADPAPITTYMVRNIRNRYSQDEVLNILRDIDVKPEIDFDFFYVPMNPKTGGNFGYGFMNFTSVHTAARFMSIDAIPSFFQDKVVCIKDSLAPASVQGYEATVSSYQHFKSSRGERARPQFWKAASQESTLYTESERESEVTALDSQSYFSTEHLVQQIVAHVDECFENYDIDVPDEESSSSIEEQPLPPRYTQPAVPTAVTRDTYERTPTMVPMKMSSDGFFSGMPMKIPVNVEFFFPGSFNQTNVAHLLEDCCRVRSL